MNGILLLCLGWCPYLLLRIVRQATKTNMQDCWSFTCCFSSKCGQLKSSIGITLVDVLQLVPLPFSQGRSTCYSNRLQDFSATIPRC